ncbi:hypothetical protein ACGFMK_35245 [Amycolatopsis sp. NPDC049252]|uniref:hypothetical protein n=1 Tax=Amycolatopsis sp. NPDC049252 TaxID=3363933 RepID=UPI00371E49CF
MTIWVATLCGGLGGSIRGVLALYRGIATWLQQRRNVHGHHLDRPRFAEAADWTAELIGMAAQIAVGSLVGFFLTNAGTVTGVSGAVLAGVSAPAILAQLGELKWTHQLVTETSGHEVAPVILKAGPEKDSVPTTVAEAESERAPHGG